MQIWRRPSWISTSLAQSACKWWRSQKSAKIATSFVVAHASLSGSNATTLAQIAELTSTWVIKWIASSFSRSTTVSSTANSATKATSTKWGSSIGKVADKQLRVVSRAAAKKMSPKHLLRQSKSTGMLNALKLSWPAAFVMAHSSELILWHTGAIKAF